MRQNPVSSQLTADALGRKVKAGRPEKLGGVGSTGTLVFGSICIWKGLGQPGK